VSRETRGGAVTLGYVAMFERLILGDTAGEHK